MELKEHLQDIKDDLNQVDIQKKKALSINVITNENLLF